MVPKISGKDWHLDAIKHRTGLTTTELSLLIRCFNGVALPLPYVPESNVGGVIFGKELLLNNLRGEAGNAHAEVARSGSWLETGDGDADAPYQINDLIEKIATLSDRQAECLIYFIEGHYYSA